MGKRSVRACIASTEGYLTRARPLGHIQRLARHSEPLPTDAYGGGMNEHIGAPSGGYSKADAMAECSFDGGVRPHRLVFL
jgi:hypothetical protein